MIKRKNDIMLSRNLGIVFSENNKFMGRYVMHVRIGNKGRSLYDITVKFSILNIKRQEIKGIKPIDKEYAILKGITAFEVDMRTNENIRTIINKITQEKEQYKFRIILKGIDSKPNEQIFILKYYDSKDIRFIEAYTEIYKKNLFGKEKIKWRKFNSVKAIEPKNIEYKV